MNWDIWAYLYNNNGYIYKFWSREQLIFIFGNTEMSSHIFGTFKSPKAYYKFTKILSSFWVQWLPPKWLEISPEPHWILPRWPHPVCTKRWLRSWPRTDSFRIRCRRRSCPRDRCRISWRWPGGGWSCSLCRSRWFGSRISPNFKVIKSDQT